MAAVNTIRLIADTRERNVLRHEQALNGITVEVRQITTGDYVVADDKRVFAVIERKSLEDYAASLKDGRHGNKQKLKEFRAKTGCRIIYIIEGPEFPSPTAEFGRVPYKHIESSIFHLMIRDGISVIRTKNTLATAEMLVRFINSMDNLAPDLEEGPIEATNETADPAIIGADDLGAMLTEVKKKTTDEIVREMWAVFPGISVESASDFMRKWSIADIVRGRVDPADITNAKTATGRKVSKKVIENLRAVILPVQFRLLSAIPGVSINTAKSLLANQTLSAFLSQNVEGMEMFMLGKKRLGNKLAVKIHECFEWRQPAPGAHGDIQ